MSTAVGSSHPGNASIDPSIGLDVSAAPLAAVPGPGTPEAFRPWRPRTARAAAATPGIPLPLTEPCRTEMSPGTRTVYFPL